MSEPGPVVQAAAPPGALSGSPPGAGNRLVVGDFRGTWAELPEHRLPPACAVLVDGNLDAAIATWAHVRTGGEMLLATAARVDAAEVELLRQDGMAVVRGERVDSPTHPRDATPGRLWLLTSGTTGRPKRVPHSLASLTTVAGVQPPRRWLCPYSPGAYAWWQVVTLSLAHPGQDVVFVDPDQLDRWPELALEHGVTAASGTPTFWRQALWRSAAVMATLPLEQITLGGEPVDQAILDRLRAIYPRARISWIYASSEAGASIAVHDGHAGFPSAWLDSGAPGRPRLTVVDGELLIESGWSAQDVQGVLRTGDKADVVGDRVYLPGRVAQDEINVGGSKASAAKVRAALLEHRSVAWAHVWGRKAPLVGQVVVAQVVLDQPVSVEELTGWCAQRLPDYAVPRRISVLDQIPIKETLKSDV